MREARDGRPRDSVENGSESLEIVQLVEFLSQANDVTQSFATELKILRFESGKINEEVSCC